MSTPRVITILTTRLSPKWKCLPAGVQRSSTGHRVCDHSKTQQWTESSALAGVTFCRCFNGGNSENDGGWRSDIKDPEAEAEVVRSQGSRGVAVRGNPDAHLTKASGQRSPSHQAPAAIAKPRLRRISKSSQQDVYLSPHAAAG